MDLPILVEELVHWLECSPGSEVDYQNHMKLYVVVHVCNLSSHT